MPVIGGFRSDLSIRKTDGNFFETSTYHLNGIFGGFSWTNGTALFSTKETKQIEPYLLIGIVSACALFSKVA